MLKIRICPGCGSEDIAFVVGGITGSLMCKRCGFTGTLFPEKEILNMKNKSYKKMKARAKKKK